MSRSFPENRNVIQALIDHHAAPDDKAYTEYEAEDTDLRSQDLATWWGILIWRFWC